MTPTFSIFTLAIKFDCIFLNIFQSFYLFVGFIFDKLAPLIKIYVSKDVLNHHLLHSSAFNSLKSAINVVFFSFFILVIAPSWLCYCQTIFLTNFLTEKRKVFSENLIVQHASVVHCDCFPASSHLLRRGTVQ